MDAAAQSWPISSGQTRSMPLELASPGRGLSRSPQPGPCSRSNSTWRLHDNSPHPLQNHPTIAFSMSTGSVGPQRALSKAMPHDRPATVVPNPTGRRLPSDRRSGTAAARMYGEQSPLPAPLSCHRRQPTLPPPPLKKRKEVIGWQTSYMCSLGTCLFTCPQHFSSAMQYGRNTCNTISWPSVGSRGGVPNVAWLSFVGHDESNLSM
jgi:hypothetical protein